MEIEWQYSRRCNCISSFYKPSERHLHQGSRAFRFSYWRPTRQAFRRAEVCTRAKRRSKEEAAAGEWAALLSVSEEQTEQEGITTDDLNQICNKGLKLMLSEDTNGLIDFQDELNTIGSTFTESKHKQGALFIYVLWKMCDHTIVDQTMALEGIYLDAFSKVFDILEDSGWSLVREKDKGEADDPSLDDLPNLPYMQQL